MLFFIEESIEFFEQGPAHSSVSIAFFSRLTNSARIAFIASLPDIASSTSGLKCSIKTFVFGFFARLSAVYQDAEVVVQTRDSAT